MLKGVCVNQQARIALNLPVSRKQTVKRHGNLDPGEYSLKLRAIDDYHVDAAALFVFENCRLGCETNRNKTDAGDAASMQMARQLLSVQPGRADHFEGRVRPSADGNISRFQ